MSQPNFSNTTATALRRSADAMLRTLGCATISLRLPGIPEGDSTAIQLGAIPIATVDVTFAPALLRAKSPASTAPRQQYEILISAIAVEAAVEAQGLDSAAALFNSALGVVTASCASPPSPPNSAPESPCSTASAPANETPLRN